MTTADPPRPPAARPRLRRWWGALVRYVGAAPGTFVWLLVLALNTFALVHMSPRVREYFLFTHSTNLDQLRHHPIKVLVTSAFLTEKPSFLLWFPVFNLFHVPAERWLGTRRWLIVVVTAHVGATLVSEGAVDLMIRAGALPHRTAYALDIGVSYALAGSIGVLTWFLARPLRWYYLGAATCFFLLLLASDRDFTNLGHLTAFLIGVGCYPVTRGVPGGGWTPRRLRRGGGDRGEKLSPLRSGASG
ncbi:rhomboid-like protein [Streptacidiphilus sp. PAMC 29251]